MIESLYVDFKRGQVLELVPKAGFRYVFEGAAITKPLTYLASDHQLTIGDPDGIRTHDLHRDRVAC